MIAMEESSGAILNETLPQLEFSPEAHLYEAALLVSLVEGDSPVPDQGTNWSALRAMAFENGVLAYACASLQTAGVKIPREFSQSCAEAKATAKRLAMALHSLLEAFADQKIDILPLKGPSLSLQLYGDAAMRSSNDLDLLVRLKDLKRATALLIGLGFVLRGSMAPYHREFTRGGLTVELHLDLSDKRFPSPEAEAVWSRASTITFYKVPAYAMSKEHLVLYLSCHGAKHRFARLIWILDVAQSLRGWREQEYESLLKQARQCGLECWLFLALAVLRTVVPRLLPREIDALTASSAIGKRATRTAERMFAESWENVGLYLQVEPSRWKRLRWCLYHLAPTYADSQWARSHHIPPGLMVALRPFRLLGKHGVGGIFHALFPPRS